MTDISEDGGELTELAETEQVGAAELLRLLRQQNERLRTQNELLEGVVRADLLTREAVERVEADVSAIRTVVDQAAPLLTSGPARALAAGRAGGPLSVLGALSGARTAGKGGGRRG